MFVKGIKKIYISQKEHYIGRTLGLNNIVNNNSGQPRRQGTMRGCGVVTWCAVMAAVFLCGLCGSSDTVMASVLRHQVH